VIGAAIMTARIPTGEIEEGAPSASGKSKAGRVGGKKRAGILPLDERRRIAQNSAKAVWGNKIA
jgi:hypothetical protein